MSLDTDIGTCVDCGDETHRVGSGPFSVVPARCQSCANASLQQRLADDEKAAVADLMRRAGIDGRYADYTFEKYPKDDAAQALREQAETWLHGYRSGILDGLYMYGAAGTGKTGLAVAIIRELCRDAFREAKIQRDAHLHDHLVVRLPGRVVEVRAYLDSVKRTFDTGDAADTTPRRLPLIVLDDLGAERETEWALEQLGLLIGERYDRMLPTIVTSNYAPDALRERLNGTDGIAGDRIVSRILQGCTHLVFDAHDRRET